MSSANFLIKLSAIAQLTTSNDTIAAMKKVEHHVVW